MLVRVCICVGRCVLSVLLTGGVCVYAYFVECYIYLGFICWGELRVFMNGGVCVCYDEIYKRT